jgi:hypothetical protein
MSQLEILAGHINALLDGLRMLYDPCLGLGLLYLLI